jgi:hypothetical protein
VWARHGLGPRAHAPQRRGLLLYLAGGPHQRLPLLRGPRGLSAVGGL